MLLKTILKKIEKYNHKKNEEFEKANNAKKRVMVLEDAIKQLNAKKYNARRGAYFELATKQSVHLPASQIVKESRPDTQVSAMIDSPVIRCNVCAVGGAFASLTRLKDRLKIGQVGLDRVDEFRTPATDWSIFGPYIEKVFPPELLECMEEAFEYGYYGYDMLDSKAALRAIYKNIISNKGKSFTSHKEGAFYVETDKRPKGTVIWEDS